MKLFKRLSILGLGLLFGIILSACNKSKLIVKNCDIIHELEFGGVYIKTTIEDFNKLGFNYGDSVDIEFSNGYKLEDQPYYNGYYVDAGETLLVGYPGYDYIKATLNYGDDLWFIAKLEENDTATVKIHEKKKYLDIQNTMNITYKDERTAYDSDEMFANFRNITVGNIKPNMVYRAASPCDNKHKRAHYVDNLIADAEVQYIMNLADTVEKIEGYIAAPDFNSPYFLSLYQNNKYLLTLTASDNINPLAMNMNYKSKEFQQKLSLGFQTMASAEGPYLIHCLEGKDRTGFVCIVLEALCGATYQEMLDDYMKTYENYYKITKEKDELRYKILKERNIDAMLRFIAGNDNIDLEKTDFSNHAKNYLIEGGMSESAINNFLNYITN